MPVNRALIERDLERMTTLAAPALEQMQADAIESSDRLVSIVLERIGLPLPGFLRRRAAAALRAWVAGQHPAQAIQLVSRSSRGLLTLSDADLAALLEGLGRQLGAWDGACDPLTDAELEALRLAAGRAAEAILAPAPAPAS